MPFGRDEMGPWRGFQAPRVDLDGLLIRRAREVGARVLRPCSARGVLVEHGTLVGVQTSLGVVRARTTIDASGAQGWLARCLGLSLLRRSRPLVARYGYGRGTCPRLDHAPEITSDEDGWTWSARVRPMVYAWTRLDVRPRRRPGSWVPPDLCRLRPLGRPRGADVTWRVAAEPAGPGYLLAGDAAAVLDPASSHGVLKALMSGVAAAHAAASEHASTDRGGASARYAAWLCGWFENDAQNLARHYRIFGGPGPN
jgi:flavin-dependent dehydrogenase